MGLLLGGPAFAGTEIAATVSTQMLTQALNQAIQANSSSSGQWIQNLPSQEIKLENIDLRGIPEVAQVYGFQLFGLDLTDQPSFSVRWINPQISAKVSAQDVEVLNVGSTQFDMRLKVTVDDLQAKISKLMFRENTLTPAKPKELPVCNRGLKKSAYYKDRVYAELQGIRLGERHDRRRHPPIQVEVVARVRLTPGSETVELISIQQNVAQTIRDHFEFNVRKVGFPPIQIEVEGECYPLNLSKVEELIRGDFETVKVQIAQSVNQWIVQNGVAMVNSALKPLRFDPHYQYAFEKKSPQKMEFQITHLTVADQTRVSPHDWHPLPRREEEPVLTRLLNRFFSVNAFVGLSELVEVDSHQIGFKLNESLSVNHYSGNEKKRALSTLKLKEDESFLITISRETIQDKINLAQSLKLLETAQVLDQGISIEDRGIKIRPISENSIGVMTYLLIDLSKMSGLETKVGYLLEKFFGGTDGKIHLPVEIVLAVTLEGTNGKKMIRVASRAYERLEGSNLKEALGMIQSAIHEKISEFDRSLTQQKIEVPIDQWTEQTGFELSQIEFNAAADVSVRAKFKSLKALIPRLKVQP